MPAPIVLRNLSPAPVKVGNPPAGTPMIATRSDWRNGTRSEGGAADYFISAAGSDANDGSSGSPWLTLNHAYATAPSGSIVEVSSGTYSGLSLSEPRAGLTDYITFRAKYGTLPTVTGVNITLTTLADVYLAVDGLNIYSTGDRASSLNFARYVKVRNCQLNCASWATAGTGSIGLQVYDCDQALVEKNKFFEVHRGIQIQGSNGVTIRRNYITPKAGSGMQYLTNNTNALIEYNHVRGEAYTPYPENPDAVQGPHASMISFRSGDVTVRGNFMHDMGSSSGCMFYGNQGVGNSYSNVLFENNVIYDVNNSYALRIYDMGTNFVVRNNLLQSRPRIEPDGCIDGYIKDRRYRYNTAIAIADVSDIATWADLKLYNNVCIGLADLKVGIVEGNNFFWSYFESGTWRTTSPSGTSSIEVSSQGGCDTAPLLMENGTVFAQAIDYNSTDGILNFRPATGSALINAGDALNQAPISMPSLDANGEFLLEDGIARSSTVHSIGPYEPV